jgi:hypothetical protein
VLLIFGVVGELRVLARAQSRLEGSYAGAAAYCKFVIMFLVLNCWIENYLELMQAIAIPTRLYLVARGHVRKGLRDVRAARARKGGSSARAIDIAKAVVLRRSPSADYDPRYRAISHVKASGYLLNYCYRGLPGYHLSNHAHRPIAVLVSRRVAHRLPLPDVVA